jgi:hypothetical protein
MWDCVFTPYSFFLSPLPISCLHSNVENVTHMNDVPTQDCGGI